MGRDVASDRARVLLEEYVARDPVPTKPSGIIMYRSVLKTWWPHMLWYTCPQVPARARAPHAKLERVRARQWHQPDDAALGATRRARRLLLSVGRRAVCPSCPRNGATGLGGSALAVPIPDEALPARGSVRWRRPTLRCCA